MLSFRIHQGLPPSSRGWPTLLRCFLVLVLATWAAGCASLPSNAVRPVSVAFDAPDETALGRLTLQRRTQAAARSDSGFRLLDSVDMAFTSRLALIERAQRSLDLQYYAIHADASTEQLLERLRAAAGRGVRVRILLDDFNSVGADAQVLRLAFLKNIELRLYNPLPGSRASLIGRIFTSLHNVDRVQKRMHNTLFIADNAWGIAGGRNLGDAYFGRDDASNFVDLDVLATGRIVRDMSTSFDSYWNNPLAYPVETLLDKEDLERLRKPLAPAVDVSRGLIPTAEAAPVTHTASVLPDVTATGVQSRALDLQQVALTWAPSALMVDKPGKVGPGDDEVDAGETLIDGLLALMGQAKSDLLIISPYFVPGDPMMKTFADLRKRGVRIRVLTNSLASNDAPAAHAGYARYRKQLLRLGVELHEMRAEQEGSASGLGSGGNARGAQSGGPFGSGGGVGGSKAGTSRASLHSKAVIIDARLAVIGSMNLDLRSQLKNSEVALVIRSPALARESIRLVENSFAKGAYRLELAGNGLVWRAPPGAPFKDATGEPEASTRLKLLVNVLGPLAPDEML
ncbi:MAG: cardiolipin synthetase (Cardiolipin synthase)-like protein [Ramlibacter sp.]|nr:cardiolipin synthetase (Cardiolipin synthase)-like protein [Ramlibacter sp.]